MNILFVGLGHMGSGMATNLVRAGHAVHGSDLSAEALAAFEGQGGHPIANLASFDLAGISAVVTMLPAGAHVRSVYLGEGGLVARAEAGTLFIDCSTIDGDSAIAVGKAALTLSMPRSRAAPPRQRPAR